MLAGPPAEGDLGRGAEPYAARCNEAWDYPMHRNGGNVENDSLMRKWRNNRGFTLAEVADLIGVEESVLSRIERGERTLSVRAKVAVARRLGVRLRDLFELDPIEALAPAEASTTAVAE